MGYNNILIIQNQNTDTFWGVLAILAVMLIVYAIGYSEIVKKRTAYIKEAKKVAIEGMEKKKALERKARKNARF